MKSVYVIAAALALGLAACGGDGEEEATVVSEGCEEMEAPEPKADGGQTPPNGPLELDEGSKGYELIVQTNCGEFVIRLDLESAPRTTASFAKLAGNGFFDETVFHRIVPGFVIQGGDPTATGTGGPGYKTVDAPPRNARYTKGVVAMAKASREPPGTSGSQFFVVTGEDIGLPPEYAIIGRVTQGLDVVDRIGRLGDRATERPTQPVVIQRMTVGQFAESAP